MRCKELGVGSTYYIQRQHGVNLDCQTVEIAEEYRYRQQEEVHRVSDVVAYQLYKLAQEHPGDEHDKANCSRALVPLCCPLQVKVDKQTVARQSPVSQSRQVNGICTPWLIPIQCISMQATWLPALDSVAHHQTCPSRNILVTLLRQLLLDQRRHCFRNLLLSSNVV